MAGVVIHLIDSKRTKWSINVTEGDKVICSGVMHPSDLLHALLEMNLWLLGGGTADATLGILRKHNLAERTAVCEERGEEK